ncbi:hypothetical protein BDW69DRAFT_169773 [Aspergillus filifer]
MSRVRLRSPLPCLLLASVFPFQLSLNLLLHLASKLTLHFLFEFLVYLSVFLLARRFLFLPCRSLFLARCIFLLRPFLSLPFYVFLPRLASSLCQFELHQLPS